jgi:hypothetical protein
VSSYLKTKWPEGDKERSSITLPLSSSGAPLLHVSKVEAYSPREEAWLVFDSLEEARLAGWVQVHQAEKRMTIVLGHELVHIFIE